MAKDKKQAFCPNCNRPVIREGNEIVCESCDAVFKITKTDGARVKKTGTLEDIQNRLAKVESEIFPSDPEPEPGPEPEPEPESDDEDSW